MTTTELIKILQDNEKGGISHKPRDISLVINGRYMPNPQISLSGTGDGVCGPEIDLDIEGDWFKQQTRWIPVSERLPKENEYIGDVCKYYLIQDEYGDMHVAHLSNVGWIPMGSLKAIGDEIIAWQELPESYKAESEDKE